MTDSDHQTGNGNTYVVVADEALLEEAVVAGVGPAGIQPLDGQGVDQILALRQRSLVALADIAINRRDGASQLEQEPFPLRALDRGERPSTDPIDGVRALAGVGALIVDGGKVPQESFSAIDGITVIQNTDILLPSAETAFEKQIDPNPWHLDRIGAVPVSSDSGDGICVGILDSGIDIKHSEFAEIEVAYAAFDLDGRQIIGAPTKDFFDHGTRVAGLLGGLRSGVAPGSKLAVAAVLTQLASSGRVRGTIAQISAGIDWLVQTDFSTGRTGVDVINASLSLRGFDTKLRTQIRNAQNLGILTIASIGNDGILGPGRHTAPGNYPEVLSVGATGPEDKVALFSNWGDKAPPSGPAYPVPDLSAPGAELVAPVRDNSYAATEGTSFASAIVSGIAAIRMSKDKTLLRSPAALKADLKGNLKPIENHPAGNEGGAGRIHV